MSAQASQPNDVFTITPNKGPQLWAINATWCPELLYGGAAGAGKSFYLLVDFLQDVPTYGAAWRGVIFRKTQPELQELIDISFEIFPPTGAMWKEAKHRWEWPNGARLRLAHCESAKDLHKFQGASFTWIGWDELTHWESDRYYKYLRARMRSKYGIERMRIRATSNPGGPGHHWVKQYFVAHAPGGYTPRVDPETLHKVMFIPGKIKDNPYLDKNDPNYRRRLMGLGSAAMVKAWLDGDWSVTEGAFFDNWSEERHVIPPFEVPESWGRFVTGDHGSAKPFAFLWFAVVSDPRTIRRRNGDPVHLPRGSLVCYRELYGWDGIHADVGLKWPIEKIALEIHRLEQQEPVDLGTGKRRIAYRIMDTGEGASDGPSLHERINNCKLNFQPPGGKLKRRVTRGSDLGGWDMLRHRLGEDKEQAMLFIFDTCAQLIRTLPALQHDSVKPEDVAPGEDHAPDALRMACMSRPYIRRQQDTETPVITDPTQYGTVMVDMEKLFRNEERRNKLAAARQQRI